MVKIATDRRTIRTKKLIKGALAQLIEEKGFNEISIIDLTTRADINRGTFYLHYLDKYDLLEQCENEFLQEMQERIVRQDYLNLSTLDNINEPFPFMTGMFEYFKENAALMKALIGPKGDAVFQNKLKKVIETGLFEKKIIKNFKKENMLIQEEYFVSYVLSAHLGVIQQWFEGGMETAPEEMALILSKMFFLGPFRVAGFGKSSDT